MSDYIIGKKSPGAALALNFIPFFIGYFYIGQWIKGLICLGASVITGSTAWPFLWIISWFDVYMQAKVLKNGGPIGQFTFFSSAVHIPHRTPPVPPQYHPPHPRSPSGADGVSKVVKDVGKEVGFLIDKASSSSSKKVCLNCGQKIDVRYMVCPFCQSPVGAQPPPQESVMEF